MRHLSQTGNQLAIGVLPLALAHGSFVILGVCVIMFFGTVIGFFTERGSGITPRPYNKVYGGAPGAYGPGSVSSHDDREQADWGRGTR
jgi:hypothetical protein